LYAHWSQRAERPDTAGQPLAPRERTVLRHADHGGFQGGGDDHPGPGRQFDEIAAGEEQIARIPCSRKPHQTRLAADACAFPGADAQ